MHANISRISAQAISKILVMISLMCVSMFSYAELEELDDKKLEEQTAKAGITIDLSFKLSIKEILFDYSDKGYNNQKTALTPPPPPIEYIHGND